MFGSALSVLPKATGDLPDLVVGTFDDILFVFLTNRVFFAKLPLCLDQIVFALF